MGSRNNQKGKIMSTELPSIGNNERVLGRGPYAQVSYGAAAPDEDRGVADSCRVFGISRLSAYLKLLEQFDDGGLWSNDPSSHCSDWNRIDDHRRRPHR